MIVGEAGDHVVGGRGTTYIHIYTVVVSAVIMKLMVVLTNREGNGVIHIDTIAAVVVVVVVVVVIILLKRKGRWKIISV